MAILRFRIYWDDDESVYRDIAIRHTQNFKELNDTILKSWEFDSKHQATFYRSNDHWLRGREISLEKYDKEYKAEPLLMHEVSIGNEIKSPNQRFIFEYDFAKNWTFLVELIKVDKEENAKIEYPGIVRVEGLGPSQYGTKGLVDKRLAEVEEKYDLNKEDMDEEGFGNEGEDEGNEQDDADGSQQEDDTQDY